MPHPENTLKGWAQNVFRRLSYDLWRRELKRLERKYRPGEALNIVDVGCGPGFLLACLEDWFPAARITGIDANEQLLAVARQRGRSVRLLQGDACGIPLENQCADVVFALHVVEHLPQSDRFFAEARRVLRPGGCLILATPNSRSLGARLMKTNWVGLKDPTHIALSSASSWHGRIQGSGFTVLREGTTGLTGVPLLNRFPLGLLHWVPTFFFGFYPWSLGEAYICVACRQPD